MILFYTKIKKDNFAVYLLINVSKMTLKVSRISKKYGSQQVLDDISFSVDKGEIVGFIGPNGAGKSTTMKIITGCLATDEGTVEINDFNIDRTPVKAKALVGYLPENNPLYDEMYVAEYLEYVAKLYPDTSVIKEKVKDIIVRVGLQPEVHKKIARLSKGYRQRVGLAQAIIHNPELLVLDEPSSGLDPNQIEEFNNLLFEMSREKAILLSSHTLSEVEAVCTRIIIIHKGRIMLDQPLKEIENLSESFKKMTL
jgi:ABC-2 type transport system ATP-binding protein